MKSGFALMAALALGSMMAPGLSAQEITFSISPGGAVGTGQAPYVKATRHPNEIFNPNVLDPYRPPEYSNRTFPTFELDEVSPRVQGSREQVRRNWFAETAERKNVPCRRVSATRTVCE